MTIQEVLKDPSCPIIDVDCVQNNWYVKPHNEVSAQWCADVSKASYKVSNIKYKANEKTVVPMFMAKSLQTQLQVAITLLQRKLEKQTEDAAKDKAAREHREHLVAMFTQGYLGMVERHGWPDYFKLRTA